MCWTRVGPNMHLRYNAGLSGCGQCLLRGHALRRPDSASLKPKAGAGPKKGMQLGKARKANDFLESLRAEGEVIQVGCAPHMHAHASLFELHALCTTASSQYCPSHQPGCPSHSQSWASSWLELSHSKGGGLKVPCPIVALRTLAAFVNPSIDCSAWTAAPAAVKCFSSLHIEIADS